MRFLNRLSLRQKKIRIVAIGLIGWSLLTFSIVNISLHYTKYILLAIISSSLVCSFLNAFLLSVYYKFQLSGRTLLFFSLMQSLLILIIQSFFDSFIRLDYGIMSTPFYLTIGGFFIFWNLISGALIRLIANVRK